MKMKEIMQRTMNGSGLHHEEEVTRYTLFIFCVHYLCLIGRVYVFYLGYVDKSSLYETCNTLSKHHHHFKLKT
jgi:hypothetical protein